MALSGRFFHGTISNAGNGTNVTMLDLQGKSGMLRTLSLVHSATSFNGHHLKIEVDGVLYYNGTAMVITTPGSNYYTMGMGVTGSTGSAGVVGNARLLNIPFTNSIKVSWSSTETNGSIISLNYSGDYVIEV